MSSKNILVDHAYKNVWCAPGVDRQFILSPTRLSSVGGVVWSMKIDGIIHNLPEHGPRFDVFTFGDILPQSLGMLTDEQKWISGNVHARVNNLLIYVYNKDGVQFPIDRVYFLHTRTGNLVVAIKRTERLTNFSRESLYIRWRSAAYFGNDDRTVVGVRTESHLYVNSGSDYLTFREHWLTYKDLGYGHALAFVNGLRVRDFNIRDLRQGDILEYIWDGDIKEVVELPLSELKTFQSDLDESTKYFFNRAGIGDAIDFVDDTDVYILNYTKPAAYTGVYYHQNKVDSIRMVTHRDYALKSLYVNGLLNKQGWSIDDDIRVEVIIRESGFDRELVDEHHRIKELFKLNEIDRINAMFGSDTGVDVWRPAELEQSMYLTLMGVKYGTIQSDQVVEAYGYNAVSRLVSNSPIKVDPDERYVNLGFNNYIDSVVYEYNTDGVLLGWYNHDVGRNYPLRHSTTEYIEVYSGSTSESTKGVYNSQHRSHQVMLDPKRDYRFYSTINEGDDLNAKWQDITGDVDYYTVVNDRVVWTGLVDNRHTLIRNDLDFVTRHLEIDSREGIVVFTIATLEDIDDKSNSYTIMTVPPGEIDIYLNGHDLVEGVDYYINWPEVSINSLRYRKDSPTQTVTYRLRGFCTTDLEFDQPTDSGFIIHNQLSRNGRFNLRDDKITRISINGQLRLPSEVDFAEDGTFDKPIPNGTPYKITHPYTPLLDLIEGKTYPFRSLSIHTDKQIEEYMDIYNPEEPIDIPNNIANKYILVSPFCSKIVEDILAGVISMDDFMEDYSQQEVLDRFDGYRYLLQYDPVLRETRTDLFTFRPHVHESVVLDVYQFKLIDRIIKVFLEDKLELNRYATLKERG